MLLNHLLTGAVEVDTRHFQQCLSHLQCNTLKWLFRENQGKWEEPWNISFSYINVIGNWNWA